MPSRRRTFLASALAVGVAGCTDLWSDSDAEPTPTDEPEFGTDTAVDSTPTDAPEYAVWSRETPADRLGLVALGGGPETPSVFAASAESDEEASDEHTLQALGLQDGDERWRLSVADPVQTPPEYLEADARSLFVFATGRTNRFDVGFVLHAIDPANRDRVWRFGPDEHRLHHPLAIEDGTVFVGRRDDEQSKQGEFVYAVDGSNGTELWQTETADVAATGHRAQRDLLFVDTATRLRALALETARRSGASRRSHTPTTTGPNGCSSRPKGRTWFVVSRMPTAWNCGDGDSSSTFPVSPRHGPRWTRRCSSATTPADCWR